MATTAVEGVGGTSYLGFITLSSRNHRAEYTIYT